MKVRHTLAVFGITWLALLALLAFTTPRRQFKEASKLFGLLFEKPL